MLALLLLPIRVQANTYFSFDNNSGITESITTEEDKSVTEDSEFASPISNTEMVTVYYPVSKQTVTTVKKTPVTIIEDAVDGNRGFVYLGLFALLLLAIVIRIRRKR